MPTPLSSFVRSWRKWEASVYEPSEVLYEVPLSVHLGPRTLRRLFFVTKETFVSRIVTAQGGFPRDWAVVQRRGFPGRPHIEELAALSTRLGLSVAFIGDFAPYDLHVYLDYKRQLRRLGVEVRWAGISHEWLALCRRSLLKPESEVLQKQSAVEREHVAAFGARPAWLRDSLGEELLGVLQEGSKLSLEAATGVGLYAPSLHEDLVRLLSRQRPAPRAKHRGKGSSRGRRRLAR